MGIGQSSSSAVDGNNDHHYNLQDRKKHKFHRTMSVKFSKQTIVQDNRKWDGSMEDIDRYLYKVNVENVEYKFDFNPDRNPKYEIYGHTDIQYRGGVNGSSSS